MKSKLFHLIITAILLSSVAFTFVGASQVESYSVGPGYTEIVPINLDSGQKFTGSLAITGGSGNDINFWVTDPQGTSILNQGRVSQGTTFEFTAQSSGAYTLHFDNSFSLLSSKAVVLTYDISSPTVFGVDFGLLLTIIGVVVILLIVIVALAVALHRRKRISKTNPPPPPPPSSPPQPSST
jgi:hypothetical protein